MLKWVWVITTTRVQKTGDACRCETVARLGRRGCQIAIAAIWLSACDSSEVTTPHEELRLFPESPNLLVGSSIRLAAFAASGAVISSPVVWTSSAPEIASVNETGQIVGKAEGTVTVRAAAGDAGGEAVVTVVSRNATVRTAASTTCGIAVDGRMYCWGINAHGQAGTGNIVNPLSEPQPVAGGLTFLSVSTGTEHTCGLTAAGPYCWGNNHLGQLGQGTIGGVVSSPAKVVGGESFVLVSANSTVQQLSGIPCVERLCTARSCALTASGELHCWGEGVATPAPVGLSIELATISLGFGYICGLDIQGHAYCWGQVNSRQTPSFTLDPANPPALPGNHRFQSISAGHGHACALDIGGDVYCWGANDAGQLGAPSDEDCLGRFIRYSCRGTPQKVETDYKFLAVAAGTGPTFREAPPTSHTCALATTLQVVCWGANHSGQLGTGTSQPTQIPAAIAGSNRFRSVTAGSAHTCAVTVEGDAYCWGNNGGGQLGDGTRTSSPVPVPVSGALKFR